MLNPRMRTISLLDVPTTYYHLNTQSHVVGLVRTDARCVRPMGYLAIFFCVFSSVLSYLRLRGFAPPKIASKQKVGFASYLRPSISA